MHACLKGYPQTGQQLTIIIRATGRSQNTVKFLRNSQIEIFIHDKFWLLKSDQFWENSLGKCCWKEIGFAIIWRTYFTKKDGNFYMFFQNMMDAITETHISVAFGKMVILQEVIWTVVHVCFVSPRGSLQFCSFNNNALKKCTNDKAFYILATVSVQFFSTLI